MPVLERSMDWEHMPGEAGGSLTHVPQEWHIERKGTRGCVGVMTVPIVAPLVED